jgi:hypothetical protein
MLRLGGRKSALEWKESIAEQPGSGAHSTGDWVPFDSGRTEQPSPLQSGMNYKEGAVRIGREKTAATALSSHLSGKY